MLLPLSILADGIDATKVGIPRAIANDVVIGVLDTAYYIAGAAAVIVLVVAGIQYATAGSDPSKVTTAKNTILYAVVGLVIIMSAFFITGFIASKF